jgi:hypothetical protein
VQSDDANISKFQGYFYRKNVTLGGVSTRPLMSDLIFHFPVFVLVWNFLQDARVPAGPTVGTGGASDLPVPGQDGSGGCCAGL